MNKYLLPIMMVFSALSAGNSIIPFMGKDKEKIDGIAVAKIKEEEELDYSFGFLELSAFPSRYKENKFGIGIGYRVSYDENISADFSFHIMKNPTSDLIYCGKINQLYYLLPKKSGMAPYIGFGFVAGLGPVMGLVDERRCTYAGHSQDFKEDHQEYSVFTNGEIVVGCETALGTKRQFFELTYYARTTTIQFSIGIGL